MQLLAAAVHRFPPLVTTVTRDRDLLNRLLDDLKLRGNEDSPFWESYGRYTGASLFLFNVLCQQDGEFAAELAEDPRLLSKLQIAMSLKLHECCRRPLMAIIDTLINHAPYPPGRKPGENFRKALFAAMWAVRSQTNPATNMLISPISKRLMDGGDEDFQVKKNCEEKIFRDFCAELDLVDRLKLCEHCLLFGGIRSPLVAYIRICHELGLKVFVFFRLLP